MAPPYSRPALAPRLRRIALLGAALALGPAPVSAAPTDEAGRHFDAGVRAFEERRFADAAAEFERAQALHPAWQVLFNLGSVYAALGRPVESIAALNRYLELGGGSIDAARRLAVEEEITRQRGKVALLEIVVPTPGAEIRVDAKWVARSPMNHPVQVAAGAHVIDVVLDGYRPEHHSVTVTAHRRFRVEIPLTSTAPPPPPLKQPPPNLQGAVAEDGSSATSPPSTGTGQRIAAYVVGGIGLAGAGVGIAMIALGHEKHQDAVDTAYAGNRPLAEDMESESVREKTRGFATLGVGSAMVLGGIVLLATAPGPGDALASRWSPWISPTAGGLGYAARW